MILANHIVCLRICITNSRDLGIGKDCFCHNHISHDYDDDGKKETYLSVQQHTGL